MHRPDVRRFLNRPAARGLSRKARAMYEVLLACGKPDLSGELNFGTVRDAWIMGQTGYSESSVYRARKELVAAGLIVVDATGLGRAITAYTLVLEAVGVEVELFEQRKAALVAEARAGGFTGPAQEVAAGSPEALSQVATQTALRGQPDGLEPSKTAPPTRAHPEFSRRDSPQPLASSGPADGEEAPLRGPEGHLASASGAAASPCAKATSRGTPCASCRACGTNPRAERARAEALRRRAPRSAGAPATHDPAQVARNQANLARLRADWAARTGSQAAVTSEAQPGADPLSGSGGAP